MFGGPREAGRATQASPFLSAAIRSAYGGGKNLGVVTKTGDPKMNTRPEERQEEDLSRRRAAAEADLHAIPGYSQRVA